MPPKNPFASQGPGFAFSLAGALSEWKDPDLGPASSTRKLDKPCILEKGELQR
jgi:hypothetical protein